jgi:elongation factor 1-beta
MTTTKQDICNSESVLLPENIFHHHQKNGVYSGTDSSPPSYSTSQADVAVFKALKSAPDATKYPNAARWYKHIATYESEFATLPGDASKPYTVYGPEAVAVAVNPAKAPTTTEEDDDDVDLFGSDDEEEDAEAARIRDERLAEYRKKKEAKPKAAAKSVVTMDVKPWDDETDMKALEEAVRGIEKDGLLWGASKLVPVGFGIKKLQITLVVEDEKVSLDELQEEIADFEDYVQSSDIVSRHALTSKTRLVSNPISRPPCRSCKRKREEPGGIRRACLERL